MGHKQLVASDPSVDYPDYLIGIDKKRTQSISNMPIAVLMNDKNSAQELKKLVITYKPTRIVDNYAEQYAELLLSKHAHLYQANYEVQVASIAKLLDEHYGKQKPWQKGTWVYYPWSGILLHILEQNDFEALRTVRNRDLITNQEQQKLYDFKVTCFGMSVGGASAQALALSGISRQIKLIDDAVISGSNLNRILTGVINVGQGKASVIGRQIYEMNPYSEIAFFERVKHENIATIFDQPWKTKLAIDEIDDIEMKIKIRLEARNRHIPVLMASDLGDTLLLDVERYDLEANRPIFHNLIPDIESITNDQLINKREWMKIAVKILDPTNMPLKLQQSVLKIGTTIVTHPQLGSTVMLTGGALAFAAKQIALDGQLKSGRYKIALEKELLADHRTRRHKRQLKKHTRIIEAAIDSMK